MFTHNINPVLLEIGPLQIYWYGLIWVLGFFLVYWVLKKRKEELNITEKQVDNFLLILMVSVIIGARIVHVLFWGLSYYLANPLKVFAVWEGGLAFHGGLIGALLAGYWFTKKYNISFFHLADILTLPAAFALALGRIANFINAELVGTVTNVQWCVMFPGEESCRHPSQLYAAAGRFLSFGLLYYFSTKEYKEGMLFWWFVLLFGIVRIVVDFYRVDELFFYLTTGQWLSIIMVVVATYYLIKLRKE